MENVQLHVAKDTLDRLQSLRKHVPKTKEYRQIRTILDHDIASVKRELRTMKKSSGQPFFTNLVALHHVATIAAILQNK